MKMTHGSLSLLLSFSFLSTGMADDATEAVEAAVHQYIMDNTAVIATSKDSESLDRVMAADIYSVEIKKSTGSWTNTSYAVYARTDDGVQPVTQPATNAPMPELLALVDPDFRLVSEDDGAVMMDAFTVLYDLEFDDVEPRVLHDGNQWTFIVDDFFDAFSGYVVDTDGEGHITAIRRSLSIEG